MVLDIKTRSVKLLHSYPEKQLCKKQMLDVVFFFIHTFSLTYTVTRVTLIQKSKVIYSINWHMYSKKTSDNGVRSELINQPVTCQSLQHLLELHNLCWHGNAKMAWTKRNKKVNRIWCWGALCLVLVQRETNFHLSSLWFSVSPSDKILSFTWVRHVSETKDLKLWQVLIILHSIA